MQAIAILHIIKSYVIANLIQFQIAIRIFQIGKKHRNDLFYFGTSKLNRKNAGIFCDQHHRTCVLTAYPICTLSRITYFIFL